MAKTYTEEEYFNALLNMRDSKGDLVEIHNRINTLSAEAGLLKKYVETLHTEVRDIRTETKNTQKWVEDNAKVTREVRDILTSFNVISSAAKWITTVAAAIAIVVAIAKGWFRP